MTFLGKLRPFQEDARQLMLQNKRVLLAHDIGLGKTVTTIAVCETLIDSGKVQSVLVIAPASVKHQWRRQLEKFTDGALVSVVEGSPLQRQQHYRKVRREEVEYLIVNYEQVVNDWRIIRFLPFDVVVADEVQAIKHFSSKRHQYVRQLVTPYRFGLSGQPMENRPEECYAIMRWVNPKVLGRQDIFDHTFMVRKASGVVQRYKNLDLFRKLMADSMHRKTRQEVADQLPRVMREEYVVPFDPPARRLYRVIAGELMTAIQDSGGMLSGFDLDAHYSGHDAPVGYGEIMPRLMALRMLCDHPKLLTISANHFDDPLTQAGSAYAASLKSRGLLGKMGSPKLDVAVELIEEILSANPANKIVVFSFFKPMLRILSEHLRVEHVLFTGDLNAQERDQLLRQFEAPQCRVFLSSDAGGVGIDLPQANFLLSIDLPWSAGKWEQRNGRIIRLSSQWPHVTLISLVMQDSIEERMLDSLQQKSAVARAWLDGEGLDGRGRFDLTLGSLLDFLSENSF